MHEPDPTAVATRLAFAADVAAAVGRRVMAIRESGRWREPALLGDVADQAADGYLQGALRARFPDDGILSEETADSAERLQKAWVWIVDPVDGTREYGQGRHDFAVQVGLVGNGAIAGGVVALPAIDRLVTADLGAAGRVQLHGEGGEWPTRLAGDDGPAPQRPLRVLCSRSHTPEIVQRVARELGGAELVPCGSVGFKVAMLLFGRADVYVHKWGLKEWDTCAPEAVARAAGFVVSRFDGREQRYNCPDPSNDGIIVCRPWLRDRVMAIVARK